MYIFESTKNTRSILEGDTKYIRSDVPTVVSEDERDWLLSNNITTIIDLRTDKERAKKRCPLIDDSRFSYHSFTITGGDIVPKCVDDVAKSYISMVDEKFNTIIDFLLTVDSSVLYFCNAGKDRTGVVSAILLHKLGKSNEYIINDYMKSKGNLEAVLKDYAKINPSIDINVITPQERYISELLQWYINYVD